MNSITHRLKNLSIHSFLILSLLSLFSIDLSAQFSVELTVIQGSVTTTCTDAPFAMPGDPTWGVAVEGDDPKFYSNICSNLTSYPNQNVIHYSTTVDCLSDLSGGQLFVCLWAFDNDISNFSDRCALTPNQSNKGCLEVLCGDFILPLPGTETTYTLDNSNFVIDPPNKVLTSTGTVTFKIAVSEDAGNNNIATNDQICNAIALPVSSGGTITERFNNYCSTSIDDPTTSFNITNSVWFKFTPSQSRRVFINVDSDLPEALGGDPIDPELAIFYAPTDECDGALVEVVSQNSPNNGNFEFLALECLNPKLTYYILVDGSNADPTGIFSVTIAERGYPTPISRDTFLCRGTVLDVGDRSYANTGVYLDTIVNGECVEVLETNLVVVEPIELDLRIGSLARGEGQGGGAVIANAQFGTGSYNYEWSSGQTNQVANNLIGGDQYCVTVTDNNAGCSVDTCFIMEFPIPIAAEVINDTLNCSYDEFGQLQLTITAGKSPLLYRLQGIDDPSVIETGIITKNDSIYLIEGLSVGRYNIFIDNSEDGQRFEAEVTAPDPITITLLEQVNLDCAGGANGSIKVEASGGTGELNSPWSFDPDVIDVITALGLIAPNDTGPADLINLPAAEYKLVITDENGCLDSATYTITEPEAPTLSFTNVSPVECFGEANGQATINSTASIASVVWGNGETTETATSLDAQMHTVTLIDDMGCESSDSIAIAQPTNPLVANIDIMEEIACGGDANGVLADATSGGNGNYEYIWSTSATTDFIDNLSAGMYNLTVRDEKGCVDDTTVTLLEPIPIDATITSQDVTCPGGESSGTITFNNPTGGTAPYQFSVNNQGFINNMEITNLRAGTYAVLMQDDKGCEKTFDQVIVNNPPEVTVNLGADMDITLGQTVELKATANRVVTYQWFTTDSLNCLDCATVSARPFSNAKYGVIVTDETTGCTAEDEISVMVLKTRNLYVPNAFSPNGDGVNDQLNLFGGEEITKVLRFEIYSRDGALVYKKENFSLGNGIGWDGEYQGQKLSTDVFIYFAEIEFVDRAREVFKGDFTLIR